MSSFLGIEEDDERLVAVLHDVVEDTYVNLDILQKQDIRRQWWRPSTLSAVARMRHTPNT